MSIYYQNIVVSLPYSGLLKELLFMGISWFSSKTVQIKSRYVNGDLEVEIRCFRKDCKDLTEVLCNTLKPGNRDIDKLKEKIASAPGSKLTTDKNNYQKAYREVFQEKLSDDITYPQLMLSALERTCDYIKKKGPQYIVETLRTKSGTVLGAEDVQFMIPAVVKQAEYYEKTTSFMKSTNATDARIKTDPVWFSILAAGFLVSYMGYVGGEYYLVTTNNVNTMSANIEEIVEAVNTITGENIRSKRRLEEEEIYELALALNAAENIELEKALRKVGRIRIYKIKRVGKAFTAEKVLETDLDTLLDFAVKYKKNYKKEQIKRNREKHEKIPATPLESLIDLAEREITDKKSSGTNEMLSYIFIKDLYRAINSGRCKVMLDSVIRLERTCITLEERGMTTSKKISRSQKEIMSICKAFRKKENLKAIVEAAGCDKRYAEAFS